MASAAQISLSEEPNAPSKPPPTGPLPPIPFERRHPASLLPISTHDNRLVHLVGRRVTLEMIDYIAKKASTVIRIDGDPDPATSGTSPIGGSPEASERGQSSKSTIPTPPNTPHRAKVTFQGDAERGEPAITDQSTKSSSSSTTSSITGAPLITLNNFILRLVKCSNVQVGTLLTTLIYLERLRTKLPNMAKGDSTVKSPI